MDFEVAGALEFLVDHIVHTATGVDQRGSDDGQAATLLDVARGTEESLRLLQRVGIDTAGQHLAGCRLHRVVGTRQAGDGVEQDHHILLVLDQALGALDHHFGDLHVAAGGLVEGRGDDLTAHGAAHLGDFFRTFVDQQHEQHNFRMVGTDGVRDVLQHHGLAGLGRRHQQTALALADRRDDVDDAAGDVFLGLDLALQLERLVRMQRRQILEQDLVLARLGRLAVDQVELGHRRVTLAILRRADLALDLVAGVQVEAANLRRRHINVVGVGEIRGFRRSQESEPVRQHFQHAVPVDALAALGQRLENGEDQLLLAESVGVIDAVGGSDLQEFGNGL